MLARLAPLALVALTLGLYPGVGLAGPPFVPSWIKNDPPTKTVTMEIVADLNQVARYAKGNARTDIIDFNGYWSGNITLIVPTGWLVRIDFINASQSFRHSLMVTRPYTEAEMPRKLEEQDAIWGAYIPPVEGIDIQDTAKLSFVAEQSGSYFLACPRQGHLKSGHWIGLEVKDAMEKAVAVIHEDKFAPEDLPGRP